MRIIKHKTNTITVPNGTVAGVYEYTVDTDNDYKTVVGIAAYEIAAAGTAYYRIGIKHEGGSAVVQEVTHKGNWLSTTSTPINDHFKEVNIPAAGTKYKVMVEIPATTVGNLVFDLVFRQEREDC